MASVRIQGLAIASDGNDLVVTFTDGRGNRHEAVREDWRSLPDGGEIYHSVTGLGLKAIIRGGE